MSDPEARQVMYDAVWRPGDDAGWDDVDRMLDALAAAGYTVTLGDPVAAEREACAGTVDELAEACNDPYIAGTLAHAAAAIRNRGEA